MTIFKYDHINNVFNLYREGSKNIQFSLLEETTISITYFENESFGIFFRDIDTDSMILMFYPQCGNNFYTFPKGDGCLNINDESIPTSDNFYFDECTHSFKEMISNYSKYERNQFCQIKKIECKISEQYYLDDDRGFGTYECWKKNNPPKNIYYNIESSKFKKCFRSCLTCDDDGNESNNNCLECDRENEFYGFEDSDKRKECHHKNEPIERYFFDSSINKFVKCRKECLTCIEKPTNLLDTMETDANYDTKCLKCDYENYWPQVDRPSNCIKKDIRIENYYSLSSYKSWEKCFIGCKYCKELGESIYDTRCDSTYEDYCSEGYFKVQTSGETINNRANCFKNNVNYDRYYFDTTQSMFKLCNVACLQCSEFSNDSRDTKCLRNKCDEVNNYFPNEDNPTICYKYNSEISSINDLPMYYYFDPDKKTFRKCQEGCLYCKEQNYANENDTQCFEKCDINNNFYKLEVLNEDNLNCYHKDRKGYYYYRASETEEPQMIKCPEKCSSCVYAMDNELNTVMCTECNNDLRYFELEKSFDEINTLYKDCRTLRAEILHGNPDEDSLSPPLNTILIGNIFKYCNNACSICTQLSNSISNPHCQARQCSNNFIYVLNYEDICLKESNGLSLHFVSLTQIQIRNILNLVMRLVNHAHNLEIN